MNWNPAALLPLVMKLSEFLKDGFDQYAILLASGQKPTPDLIAAFLAVKLDTWNPMVANRALLDSETRHAAARFLAGVAFNMAKK